MTGTRTVSVKLTEEDVKKYRQKFDADSDSAMLREALDKVHKEDGFWVSFFDNFRLKRQISDLESRLQKSTDVYRQSTDVYRQSTEVYQRSTAIASRVEVVYGCLQESTDSLPTVYRQSTGVDAMSTAYLALLGWCLKGEVDKDPSPPTKAEWISFVEAVAEDMRKDAALWRADEWIGILEKLFYVLRDQVGSGCGCADYVWKLKNDFQRSLPAREVK